MKYSVLSPFAFVLFFVSEENLSYCSLVGSSDEAWVLPWTQGSCEGNSKNSTVGISTLHLHLLKLELVNSEETELLGMLSKTLTVPGLSK